MVGSVLIEKATSAMTNIYKPKAIYHGDSDCVEYTRVDGGTYYDRIDNFLTLIFKRDTKEAVGFKLKGFKYILQNHDPDLKLSDEQFSMVMHAFGLVFTELGNSIFENVEVRQAYDIAVAIAANDNVKIDRDLVECLLAA